MKILGNSRGIAVALAILAGAFVAPPAAAQPAPADKPAAEKPQTPAAPKAPAPAADKAAKPADARALLASGEKKLKASDFAGALADFQASNTAKPSPDAQLGIARAHDNLGNFAEAVAAYEAFLADVPAKMKEQGETAKARVDAIKAMPGKVHLETTPPGANITVDGQPGQSPTPIDLELPPGKHKITITVEGFEPAEKEIDVTFASKQDVNVELVKPEAPPPPPPVVAQQPPPPPPPPPAPPPEPRSKVPAYVTGAVAIVAAGVGTGFGIKALQQSNDFEERPTTKRADDGENNALVADMMFGIAITFGVTSAVLFLSSDEPKSAKSNSPSKAAAAKKKKVTITPAPYVSPSGGGVGTVVQF